MDAATWKRLRAAFEGALALAPAERARFLERACREDGELRARVEELLRQDGARDTPLEAPWRMELEALAPDATVVPERRVGPYELERVIGHGGMGTVFLARRADEHFQKRVALKLIRRGMDTDDILRRFRNERQVLADLEHPGIARLLDGGATEDGRPYLVLEYVEGERLDAQDPSAPNYDPQARAAEGPVHDVTLSPFFLSKYEMTQGQWTSFVGSNPSFYQARPGVTLLAHPVERVSWEACEQELRRLGLRLPSEAQWEYLSSRNSNALEHG